MRVKQSETGVRGGLCVIGKSVPHLKGAKGTWLVLISGIGYRKEGSPVD